MNSFLRKLMGRGNIHLDYASTTPVTKSAVSAMKPYLSELFHNPSSSYMDAQRVKRKIKECRIQVACMMQVKESEIIFTQGGTESNNLAIIGLAKHAVEHFDFVPHMIFSEIEHPAVSECIPVLRKMGVEVDTAPVTASGIVDVQALEKLLNERTVLVSVIAVSNEIGTIQPVHRVSSSIKKFKNELKRSFAQYPFLHTDASQAILTEDVSVARLGADMISLDASKMYGPKMTGILVRKQHVPLEPIVYGGGQEYNLRSGTENVAGMVGVSEALRVAKERREDDRTHFESLKNLFMHEINASGIAYELQGDVDRTVSHIINICIPGLNSDFAVIQLDEMGINCSAMTACASAKGVPKSQVIEAMGKPDCAGSSLRFSFGRTTTRSDIKAAISKLKIVCGKQKV